MTTAIQRVAILLALSACSASSAAILVHAPTDASRLELTVLPGDCPSDPQQAINECAGVRYRQSIERGGAFTIWPSIEGEHAIVVMASGDGRVWYTCTDRDAPADVRIEVSDFRDIDGCGAIRQVGDDRACSDADCSVPSTTLIASQDHDEDGVSNCFECCENADDVCECHEIIEIQSCRDTDMDGDRDYADPDSDNDGIFDSVECPSTPGPCRDTDRDGLPDFRDTDSDGDEVDDRMECPDGDNGTSDSPTCPSNDDGTLDYLRNDGATVPPECDCRDQDYSCEDGDLGCYQTGIMFSQELMLRWVTETQDLIVEQPIDVLDDLGSLEPPPDAWRCGAPGCDRDTVAVAHIVEGDAPIAYFIDLRQEDAQAFVYEFDAALAVTLRLGRFVYSVDAEIVAEIQN